MQVLKDSVKTSIIESAKSSFIEKGFEKTSMKEIATKAGISKSNLYNYFSSKEDIFDTLTHSIRNKMDEFLNPLLSHDFDDPFGSDEFIMMLSFEIYKNLLIQREEFILLMNGSNGTRYSYVKQDLIDKLEKHFISEVGDPNMISNSSIMKVIATNLIEGIVTISLDQTSKTQIQSDLEMLMKYHVNGIRAFF